MSDLRAQRGTTLIEVLVTIVLLAIGLLGLAGLQVSSVQSNHSAYHRSQATILAYDISDRMRGNRTAALNGDYDDNDFPESSSTNPVGGSRAQQDKAEWLNTLADVLPGGTGRIERADHLITIHVRWDDSRGEIETVDDEGEPAATETFVYRTEI